MNNEDNSFGTNGFQMMGLMNAFKTGDPTVDVLIAMCIPFILKLLFGWIERIEDIADSKFWSKFWTKQTLDYERYISHSTTRNSWGGTYDCDEDTKNSVLLKAIKMYLHQVVRLNLRNAHLDLTQLREDSGGGDYGYYDRDSDDDEIASENVFVN